MLGILPDVVAALDLLVPRLATGADRAALRRYYIAVDSAAQTLAALPASRTKVPPPVMHLILRRHIAELAWVAPSADGTGVLTAMVDAYPGTGRWLPPAMRQSTGLDIDEHRFGWFLESIVDLEFEQRCGSPLKRAMATLDLSSTEMAGLMGVTRQAVGQVVGRRTADRADGEDRSNCMKMLRHDCGTGCATVCHPWWRAVPLRHTEDVACSRRSLTTTTSGYVILSGKALTSQHVA